MNTRYVRLGPEYWKLGIASSYIYAAPQTLAVEAIPDNASQKAY